MGRDDTYKGHILDAIEKIETYTAETSHATFIKSFMVQDAVIRELQIIGEASKRLSAEFKASTPGAEWKKIAGTRDILIHDYGTVDLDEVWKIVQDDLPKLKSTLK